MTYQSMGSFAPRTIAFSPSGKSQSVTVVAAQLLADCPNHPGRSRHQTALEDMTIRYLLPCPCGAETHVDVSQAGETVVCQCGATLDVPTMRQLRQLECAESKAVETGTNWGLRQGFILLALVVTVVAGTAAGYLWGVQPAPPKQDTEAALKVLDRQIEDMTPLQSWELWQDQILADGLVQYEDPAQSAYHAHVAVRRRWSKVLLALAGCGLLTLLSTVLLAGDGDT